MTAEPKLPDSKKSEHNTSPESEKQTNTAENQIFPTSAKPQANKTPHGCEITCNTNRDWIDWATIALEAFGLTVLIIYTIYTAKMYCANRDAADAATRAANTAANQLELAERPWVDANIVLDGPFDFNANGANIHLKVALRNSGHSPAQSVATSYLALIGSQAINAAKFRQQVCDAATSMGNFSVTLFPNVNFEQRQSIGIGKEDIEKWRASKEFPGSNFGDVILSPTMIVCIGYRPTFKHDSVYHTAYIVDLFTIDSANRLGAVFKIGETVDPKHLFLRMHVLNAISAD